MNVPMVIFWNLSHWELHDSAISYYDDLKRVGIYHETPESADQYVTAAYDDVDTCWTSLEVQKATKRFKGRYYRADNMLDYLESILKRR